MVNCVLLLIVKCIVHYLHQGSNDVHIVFNNPGRINDHPKCVEHKHRDGGFVGHQSHCTFSDDTKAPNKWSEVLKCRECKRAAVKYVGDGILRFIPTFLTSNQKVVVAGHHDGKEGDLAYYSTRTTKKRH